MEAVELILSDIVLMNMSPRDRLIVVCNMSMTCTAAFALFRKLCRNRVLPLTFLAESFVESACFLDQGLHIITILDKLSRGNRTIGMISMRVGIRALFKVNEKLANHYASIAVILIGRGSFGGSFEDRVHALRDFMAIRQRYGDEDIVHDDDLFEHRPQILSRRSDQNKLLHKMTLYPISISARFKIALFEVRPDFITAVDDEMLNSYIQKRNTYLVTYILDRMNTEHLATISHKLLPAACREIDLRSYRLEHIGSIKLLEDIARKCLQNPHLTISSKLLHDLIDNPYIRDNFIEMMYNHSSVSPDTRKHFERIVTSRVKRNLVLNTRP